MSQLRIHTQPWPFILLFALLLTGCFGSRHRATPVAKVRPVKHTPVIAARQAPERPPVAVVASEVSPLAAVPSTETEMPATKCEVLPVEDSGEQLVAADPIVPAEAGSRPLTAGETRLQPALDDALDDIETAQEFWQQGELEKALDALDQAYALILEVDTANNPKLIQQKEDLRFLISKRILEIYASRNIVVNGDHDAIPLIMNRHVEAEIRKFTTVERKFFQAAYKRSGRYREKIVASLKEAGLPEELSWLPLIESGYKVKAMSRARALGMWQFIPSTGYKFGLKRNTYIDERMDPIKSTRAAIAYMKELHQMFGDWTTVLAAYNCGEGRVLRLIRGQNINYLDNFWDLYERLPRETARYVPRFLATLHMIRNPQKYGLDCIQPDAPLTYDEAEIDRKVHLSHVAKILKVRETDIRNLNPELRYRVVPGDDYKLRLPAGKSEILLANLSRIPDANPPRPAYGRHRVRKGESLSSIAARYRTSIGRLARANNLRSTHFIRTGQILKIPQGKVMARMPRPSKRSYTATTHRVRKGDSLWNIARRYGTTVKKIQTLNGLKGTALHIGQRLSLRTPKSKAKSTAATQASRSTHRRTYLVRMGDSPFTIAQRHKISLKQLQKLNRLSSRSTIYPGQKLFIE